VRRPHRVTISVVSSPAAERFDEALRDPATGPPRPELLPTRVRAHDDGRTIAVDPEAIHRNWPEFYRSFLADTPFRGVLSVPLPEPLGSAVVLDLFLGETAALGRLEREDVAAVTERVTAELARDLREATRIPTGDSSWLEATDAPEVVRAAAISSGRTVDEVATDLLTGRLQPLDLAAAPIPDDARAAHRAVRPISPSPEGGAPARPCHARR
jgi:hypothetical protein